MSVHSAFSTQFDRGEFRDTLERVAREDLPVFNHGQFATLGATV